MGESMKCSVPGRHAKRDEELLAPGWIVQQICMDSTRGVWVAQVVSDAAVHRSPSVLSMAPCPGAVPQIHQGVDGP